MRQQRYSRKQVLKHSSAFARLYPLRQVTLQLVDLGGWPCVHLENGHCGILNRMGATGLEPHIIS